MSAFTVKATVHDLEAGFIVTPLNGLQTEFRIEIITNCKHPVILEQKGKR